MAVVSLDTLLAIVYIFLIWLFVKTLRGLWTCWFADLLGQNYQWKVKDNSWAIVTGATDGIGLEYAKVFASKGFSLLLISRTESKLDTVKASIQSSYPKCKEVRILVIDFGKPQGIYEKMQKEIESLPDIGVLVNNVGISYCTPEYYAKLEATNAPSFIDDVININMVSVAKMVKIVLPKMEAQRRGVIINISSISAAYPTPFLSIYGGSKSFVDLFSRSVASEYEDKGIVIQTVMPAYVATNMSKIKKPTLMAPTPANFVKAAMKTVGVETRTYGYWTHKLQGFVMDQVISPMLGDEFVVKLARGSLIKINQAYYRKYMNNKKE